ncbi:glycosyltransferase family 2 protein [Flavobacterium psychrolimnae]|uniref:Glycosyltransferase family 2 protein n=1 Tax=Flavobacterium psychrolimnae TaxID=249351 RepID=A0A366AZL6_9FLAO|nr:glycosyltransferase family 2 protein [Flavobacterium psychrolimnae]RBN50309.1 glycosyltransferase family 2 protein [Flavobacterium psychrolimnae]
MKPKITIIMATYNRAHFIMETLESIQNQSFKNWECLIIDDGGTDDTKKILVPILEQDDRFQFLKRSYKYKKGLPGCRNCGLDIAKGEFIVFFDDDDLVHPDNLKISLEVIEINNIDFCHYQKMSFVEERPIIKSNPIAIVKSLSKSDIEKIITQEIGLASCTVLWKKQCFDFIRFNESLLYAEEWECYTRIIAENFKGIIIDNVLYYNRKHPDSNTGEFYRNNSIRRESYTKAVLLVIKNLKEKELLSASLKRYFVTLSKNFTEYNLFIAILNVLDLTIFEKIKWQLFYISYPIRLPIYKIKKALQK